MWKPLLAVVAAAALTLPSSAAGQRKDPYVLTREEIATQPEIRNAYDAVQRLRPRFLTAHEASGRYGADQAGVLEVTTRP